MTADPGKEMGFARNAGNEERVVDVVSAGCDAAGRRSLTSGAAGSVTRGLSRRWMRRASRQTMGEFLSPSSFLRR